MPNTDTEPVDSMQDAIDGYRHCTTSGVDDVSDIFRHADGSVTIIRYDSAPEYANPRDNDGNIAHLVMEHRDYRDLDTGDSGIEEARDRWGWTTGPYLTGGTRSDRAVKAIGQEGMVARYLAIFRPDIALYVPRWEVQGTSQSDWAYGYGYVLTEDLADITGTAQEAFDLEVKVYGQYFAGEVYGATHLTRGEAISAIGPEGGYFTGEHNIEDESVWGFLGYDNTLDICAEMTASPVVERIF